MKTKITHIGIYTMDLERLRAFYEKYFDAKSNEKYVNNTGFSSYFLTIEGDVRIELMTHTELTEGVYADKISGVSHIAFSLGSKEAVEELTQRLIADGYKMYLPPRSTGDGYFESCMSDPDGNRIELTI